MYSVIVYSNGNISSREPPIRDSNCSNATRTWIPWKFFFFFQKIIWPVLTHQIRIDFGHIKPAKAILLCWGWSTTSMVLGVISSYRIINNSIEEYAKLVYWAVDLYMFEKEGSMKWRKKHLEEMLLQQYWWNFWQFSK